MNQLSTLSPVPPTKQTVSPAGQRTAGRPRRPRRRQRLLAVLGAALAAGAVWLVAGPLLGLDLGVSDAPGGPVTREIGLVAVVASACAAGLAGWALLALFERVTGRATNLWRGSALTVAGLSLAGPVLQAGSLVASVTLGLMHLAVAAVLVPGLTRRQETV